MNTENKKSRNKVKKASWAVHYINTIPWHDTLIYIGLLFDHSIKKYLVKSWLTFDLKELKLFCRHTQNQ